jgi:hypothetical protein
MSATRVLRREGTSGESANLPSMPTSGLQSRADGLAARIEGLAAALHDSRVSEETAARLLSQASTAALQALTLELLLDQPEPAPTAADEPEALAARVAVPVEAAA